MGIVNTRLSAATLKKIWEFSHLLGKATTSDEFITTLFDKIGSLVKHDTAIFVPADPLTGAPSFEKLRAKDVPQSKEANERYAAYYNRIDPMWNTFRPELANTPLPPSESVPSGKFKDTEFYCDFFIPFGMRSAMSCPLFSQGRPVAMLAFQRGLTRDFNNRSTAALALIAPFISQAFQNVRTIESGLLKETGVEKLDRETAIWVLDMKLRIVQENARARGMEKIMAAIKQAGKTETEAERRFPEPLLGMIRHMHKMRRFSRKKEFAPNPQVMSIDLMIDRTQYIFTAMLVHTGAQDSVIVTAHTLVDTDRIASMFFQAGLTEREKEVASLVAGGQSNVVIGGMLGISEATVKRHVRAILAKTCSKNRAEFLSKLI